MLIKNASIPPDADNWWDRLEFREIGGGNLGIDFGSIFSALKATGFEKWFLIEQDTHKKDPLSELTQTLKQIIIEGNSEMSGMELNLKKE